MSINIGTQFNPSVFNKLGAKIFFLKYICIYIYIYIYIYIKYYLHGVLNYLGNSTHLSK